MTKDISLSSLFSMLPHWFSLAPIDSHWLSLTLIDSHCLPLVLIVSHWFSSAPIDSHAQSMTECANVSLQIDIQTSRTTRPTLVYSVVLC